MPVAYGGSYDCSVYKRLMRSMSSSLSNSQIINNNEDSNLNDSFNNINDNVLMCKQCVCSHLLFSSLPTNYLFCLDEKFKI